MVKRIAIGAVILYLLANLAIGILLSSHTLHPPRRQSPGESPPHYRKLQSQASDGAVLSAVWREGTRPTIAVVLHGQADHLWKQLGAAEILAEQGYSVLVPDSRAHGDSGGEKATYGIREVPDLQGWIAQVSGGKPRPVALLGTSMGAAIALQALKTNLPLCAVVAESPFSDFREVGYDSAALVVGGGPIGRTLFAPSIDLAIQYMKQVEQIDFAQVRPVEAARNSKIPILLIHSEADLRIPQSHSRRILEAAGNAELWAPADTPHTAALGRNPAEWRRHVLRKLDASCP